MPGSRRACAERTADRSAGRRTRSAPWRPRPCEVGGERVVATLAHGLGLVHRHVRIAEQVVDAGHRRGVDGDADARADLDRHARRSSAGPGSSARSRSATAWAYADVGDVHEQDAELVATEARREVRRAQPVADARRDRRQELVAGGVAEAVVDGLEVVEVEEERGDRPGLLSAGQRGFGVLRRTGADWRGRSAGRGRPGSSAGPRGRAASSRRGRASGRCPARRTSTSSDSTAVPSATTASPPSAPGPIVTSSGPVIIAAARQAMRTGPSQVMATGCGSVRWTIDGCAAATPNRM